ncbi:hypothetical protein BFRIG_04031 [Peribacillus frigoritolerans]
MAVAINLSFEEMWEKIIACDPKYDGLFFTAVKTTKFTAALPAGQGSRKK